MSVRNEAAVSSQASLTCLAFSGVSIPVLTRASERIVDELNDMDEDEAGMPKAEIERRLAAFLVGGPGAAPH